MAKTYRKKPVEVQAIRFTGWNWSECLHFIGARPSIFDEQRRKGDPEFVDIETLEGTMRCMKGDYIIRGVNGEFYPCKADIFKKTYESVE